MNTKLNLNEKVSINFMNDYNTSRHGKAFIAVEYLEINNTKYFNDTNDNSHLTIRGFIKDIIIDNFREEIKENNQSEILENEVKTFFNHFLHTCRQEKIDLSLYTKNNIDTLYNDLFQSYADSLKYEIEYDFDRVFNGQLGISRKNNHIDLSTMKLKESWTDNKQYVFKTILKILNHVMLDKNSQLSNIVSEYIELDNYLSDKKTVNINGKKQDTFVFGVLRALIDSNTKVIKYAKKLYKLNYIQEINHYLRV